MSLDESKQADIGNQAESDSDAIGPGQPPKQHRFKKGTSGNLKGRPKKPPKPHDLLWEELKKPITLKTGGKEVRATRLEAMLRQLKSLAMKGHPRAMKLYLARVEQAHQRKEGFKRRTNPSTSNGLTKPKNCTK